MFHDIANVSLFQQHPLLLLTLHLSTCFFWFLETIDSTMVLIFCFVGQEQGEDFPC
jgi:hypothetical protein